MEYINYYLMLKTCYKLHKLRDLTNNYHNKNEKKKIK